jgi:hypothetical protein
MVVGTIVAPTWRSQDHKWQIRLMFESDDSWKWRFVIEKFDTEPAAREWLQARVEKLTQMNLHKEDPKDW